jgi:hypothetical protein
MRPAPALSRLAVAAALGGAALAATPALASASSTCSYNTSNHNLIINDRSGTEPLRIFRTPAGELRFSDGASGTGVFCFVPNTPTTATVTNTDRIAVFTDPANATQTAGDGYHVDLNNGPLGPGATPETDGNSEVEVAIATTAGSGYHTLRVLGGPAAEEIRVGQGGVNLGTTSTPVTDQDADITTTAMPPVVEAFGRGGADMLSGGGNEISGTPAPFGGLLTLSGGPGADTLVAGSKSFAHLTGGLDDDRMFTDDRLGLDTVREFAGQGKDVAQVDDVDTVTGEVEQRFVSSTVGKLRLTPRAATARAGGTAHLALAWKHPQAWKQLRSIVLRARDGGTAVGTVRIDAAHRRITGTGALKTLPASEVGHHGTTVAADLAVRVPARLAGHGLRLEVEATDTQGRTQVEPLAGGLAVAK